MTTIDLRSDTVTLPSPAMRQAMAQAEVGDDVYSEDPTVNRLQEKCAELMGKESGLFVASGTMGNFVSLLTHCGRGNEVIAGSESHIILHEQGSAAALGGIYPRTVKNAADGTMPIEEVEDLINEGDDDHIAKTRLICLENTWNGCVLPSDYVKDVGKLAKRRHLKLHLDGARIFNAAVALKRPVRELVADFDSVQFCFSKGLSAPVGSMIVGNREFIKEAKRNRKMVGGGMRQVGVLAAGCLVALDEMVERLDEDHQNAKLLAAAIADCSGLQLEPLTAQTNIVVFSLASSANMSADAFVSALAEHGLLMLPLDKKRVRAVTHYGVERADVENAINIVRKVAGARVAVSS